MAVIVELQIPATEFDLGRVTEGFDDVRIELERVVPTGGEVMPYFWAMGGDLEAFDRHVRENRIVEKLTELARVDGHVLYYVEWGATVASLTEILAESEATILEAFGDDPWTFRLRFRDHAGLRDFHNACRERGIDFEVEKLYTLEEEQVNSFPLEVTPEQHEALVAAVERGYFEVPRAVTLGEIAADLGISQQAASERVRRGANAVLRRVLLSGTDEE